MTFRELPVGERFRFHYDSVTAEVIKTSEGEYLYNGWTYTVRPSGRDVAVIRIDTPKEGEK